MRSAFDALHHAHVHGRQDSKWVNTGRDFRLNIMKVDEADEHWPRLVVEQGRLQRIQVDWARYVDEDEEDQIDPDSAGSGFGPPCTFSARNTPLAFTRISLWRKLFAPVVWARSLT
ncbi:hypothetical protein N9K45_00135 [bacterium]|jgi:hypothetical protein|nr:hypothetical protein [bacterium]